MKKAVLKFTACCAAAGMAFAGTGSVAFAAGDTVLAGFGYVSVQGSTDAQEQADTEQQTVAPVENSVEEDTSAEEAPAEEAVQDGEASAEEVQAETEAPQTEPVVDTSMSGQMAFAQCEEYINVRSDASADSEVVGKVYNNGSVTILSQVGDWYEVQSGNAVGYVKADYFATGEQAEAIAEEVAYNVATVYPEALMIRSQPSEDSESVGMAYNSDELEVVAYEGDWMKVALGGDSYGYVNAYYVDYDTYYATAETLEEEQARLDAEWLEYLAQQEAQRQAEEQAYLEAIAAEQQAATDAAAAQAASDAAAAQAAADAAAAEAAYQAQLAAQAQSQTSSSDAQAVADAAYQEYLNAQAAADAATLQADEQLVYDTAAQAQAEYQEYLNAQAAADAAAAQQASDAAAAQAAADAAAAQAAADAAAAQAAADAAAAQAAADAAAQQAAAEQAAAEQAAQEQASQEQASNSSAGQAIVNFATQFVGNPYVWGGTSLTNGADCSGFTQSVFANFGISIPRTAAAQSGSGTPVDLSEIQAGDLLFYYGSSGIGHVTIYMGNGQVVHASSPSTGIVISDYGYRTPCSARRYW